MKIFYPASYDVSDLASGNGTDHFKMEALRAAGCELERFSPIVHARRHDLVARITRRLKRAIQSNDPIQERKAQLRQIGHAIRHHPYHAQADAIVCPNHFDISFYEGGLPVFFWTDATYKDLDSLSYRSTIDNSEEKKRFESYVQRRAIQLATGALWASRYAMQTAVREYEADPKKQAVTGFGLNIPGKEQAVDLAAILASRESDVIQLIFIGSDYKRKGLDIALEAVVDLNNMGVAAKLHTIGSCHPVPESARNFVNVLGSIDKRDPAQLELFKKSLQKSHFFIFPTRADVYCMPAIEAMSVGCVPVVSDVGGISEIVKNNETGILLPLSAPAGEYARSIASVLQSERYAKMAHSSHRAYLEHHRWSEIGSRARAFIEQRLSSL